MKATAEERFCAKVRKTDSCWYWTGPPGTGGYGQFWVNELGRSIGPHRWAYENLNGPVEPEMTLDHTCHTEAYERGECGGGPTCPHRLCVRPDHLAPVTRGDNALLGAGPTGRNQRKAYCIRNHEFTPENTRTVKDGSRACRTCERMRSAAYYRTPAGRATAKRLDAKRKAERRAKRQADPFTL